ncbi:MAG TPA: hypothetical protein VH008_03455 [Pseudonocardia sp.]|nr:hypothetical protein [Pseudonocardia sp.]
MLDAVESAVERRQLSPGGPLSWEDGFGAPRSAGPELLELVLSLRERHSDGDLVTGAASVGDLRGRSAGGVSLVAVSWELGAEGHGGTVRLRFAADAAGPLETQSPSWLADLLCAACALLEATQGQVTTRTLSRLLGRRGASLAVGALTLLPDGLPREVVAPPGFTALPAPTGYPNGEVLVADLQQVAQRPEVVADALVDVDQRLARWQDESRLR